MYLPCTLIVTQGQLSASVGKKGNLGTNSFISVLYRVPMYVTDVKSNKKKKNPDFKFISCFTAFFEQLFLLFALQKHFALHISTYGKEEQFCNWKTSLFTHTAWHEFLRYM